MRVILMGGAVASAAYGLWLYAIGHPAALYVAIVGAVCAVAYEVERWAGR